MARLYLSAEVGRRRFLPLVVVSPAMLFSMTVKRLMRTYVIYGFCILACNTLIVIAAGDFDAYVVKVE